MTRQDYVSLCARVTDSLSGMHSVWASLHELTQIMMQHCMASMRSAAGTWTGAVVTRVRVEVMRLLGEPCCATVMTTGRFLLGRHLML